MMYPTTSNGVLNKTSCTDAGYIMIRLCLLFTPLLLLPLFLPASFLSILSSTSLLWISSTDSVLHAPIPPDDISIMRISPAPNRTVPEGNPWRGAGSRRRHDLLSSVSGCGGSVVPALQFGSIAAVRYVVRNHLDHVVDSAKSDVHIVIGAGQTSDDIDSALIGVCAGELVSVRIPRGNNRREMSITIYVSAVFPSFESSRTGFRNGIVQNIHVGKQSNVHSMQMTDDIAAAVTAIPSRRGGSCTRTCTSKGLVCDEDLFPTVNNCPKLKQVFMCVSCQIAPAGSAGADMPAWVSKSAPAGHARAACLVAPHSVKSSCNARYTHTRRLCPCLDSTSLKNWKRIRVV